MNIQNMKKKAGFGHGQYEFDFVSEVTSPMGNHKKNTSLNRPVDTMGLVKEFHDLCGVATPHAPDLTNDANNKKRIALLDEELTELEEALADRDPVAALDALSDIQYVLDGAFLELGLSSYKYAAFKEVQRSNMSKMGEDGKPLLRADGKILKGPNYFPPDLESVMKLVDSQDS